MATTTQKAGGYYGSL